MSFTFDGVNRRIILSPGTTQVVVEEMYSRWKEWVRASGSKYLQAFRSVGREPDGLGGFTGAYIFFMNGWSVVPQSANHTLQIVGNPFRDPQDTSEAPLVQTVAGYTINIIVNRSSQAQGVVIDGGFKDADRSDLATVKSAVQDLSDLRGYTEGNPVTVDKSTGTITTQDGKSVTVTDLGNTRTITRTS